MGQWLAGMRITASQVSVTTLTAASTADLQPTATFADIVGASLTFTTNRTNVRVRVIGAFDCGTFGAPPTDAGVLVGQLVADGVGQTSTSIWQGASEENRAKVGQVWVLTLAAAGSHTVKLQGRRVGGTQGGGRFRNPHTTITAIIEDSV